MMLTSPVVTLGGGGPIHSNYLVSSHLFSGLVGQRQKSNISRSLSLESLEAFSLHLLLVKGDFHVLELLSDYVLY